jgi:small ligand-binding sensory domain FIST
VLLHELLGARTLIGCSGAVVVDGTNALAGRHGIALLAARLPGTRVDAVAIAPADLPSPDAGPAGWRALLPPSDTPRSGMIVLTEPFHMDLPALLTGLDFGFPDVVKVGGVASGSRHPEGNALFCGRTTHRSGAVVLALQGACELAAVVAPGCRPFGRAGRVTRSTANRLLAVDGAPARAFVHEQLATLDAADRELAATSPLLLGVAADPLESPTPPDDELLVRNILGVDTHGDLVVSQHLPVGRAVRLLMRDPGSGAEELARRLREAAPGRAGAALLFQCLGRETKDHETFAALAADVPLVGFHCNSEIGPVGATTHVHAFTAAVALFFAKDAR